MASRAYASNPTLSEKGCWGVLGRRWVAGLLQWEPPALRVEGSDVLTPCCLLPGRVPLQPNSAAAHKGGCCRDPLQWASVGEVLRFPALEMRNENEIVVLEQESKKYKWIRKDADTIPK